MPPETSRVLVISAGQEEQYLSQIKGRLESNGMVVEISLGVPPGVKHINDLIPEIDRTEVVLVPIGRRTREHMWIDLVIEHAARQGNKRIVGICLPDGEDSGMPDRLNDYGDACVAWRSDNLLSAVQGKNVWEDCSGKPRKTVNGPRPVC